MEKSWAGKVAVEEPLVEVPPGAEDLRGAKQVQQSARVTAFIGGGLLAAVAVHAARTVQGLLRR